jgi:hypothetical protein
MRGGVVTQLLQYAEGTPPDPIWLRTLATVLPVVGTILVALLTGPTILERLRERKREKNDVTPPPEWPGVPTPVAVAAAERASVDPVLRLFIDDLHQRLNLAHGEAAELHRLRAADAGTIARLTTELADRDTRLQQLEQELADKTRDNRHLKRRLEEYKVELEQTRRKLAICLEGKQP